MSGQSSSNSSVSSDNEEIHSGSEGEQLENMDIEQASDVEADSDANNGFTYEEEGENGFTFDDDPTLKMPSFQNGKLVYSGLSDDEEDNGEEEMNDFEKEAEEAEEEEKKVNEEALANIKDDIKQDENIDITAIKDNEIITDVSALKGRIQDVVAILGDFRNKRDPKVTRDEYMQRLIKDCYSEELAFLFLDMFSPSEAIEWFEANEADRPVVIRTNTLKTKRKDLAQALLNRGVNLDPLGDWTKVGLKVYDTPVPIGATPEYLAGHYMLQSAASFLPVMALDPKPNERILDMCSAPGGKTSYICQLMKNTGVVIANDINKDRLVATVANIHRLGITNCVVSNYSGLEFPAVMGGFDRILLDAPCSGLGVISRDKSVKMTRTIKEIEANSCFQKKLILAAIDSIDANSKTGGILVYSTCSITVMENESVVNYALKKRFVKLVDISKEIPFGKPGMTRYKQLRFNPSCNKCRRFYPHVQNMDGFFVAKFVKYSNSIPKESTEEEEEKERQKEIETLRKVRNGEDISESEEEDQQVIEPEEEEEEEKMDVEEEEKEEEKMEIEEEKKNSKKQQQQEKKKGKKQEKKQEKSISEKKPVQEKKKKFENKKEKKVMNTQEKKEKKNNKPVNSMKFNKLSSPSIALPNKNNKNNNDEEDSEPIMEDKPLLKKTNSKEKKELNKDMKRYVEFDGMKKQKGKKQNNNMKSKDNKKSRLV
ncbi:hypothetical protein WA158_000940 [Blastocystis sp. Blastoise]